MFLAAHGANVNIPDKNGKSPFMIAVHWEYVEIAKTLYRLGA